MNKKQWWLSGTIFLISAVSLWDLITDLIPNPELINGMFWAWGIGTVGIICFACGFLEKSEEIKKRSA